MEAPTTRCLDMSKDNKQFLETSKSGGGGWLKQRSEYPWFKVKHVLVDFYQRVCALAYDLVHIMI